MQRFSAYLDKVKKPSQFSLKHLISPIYKLKSEVEADTLIMAQAARVQATELNSVADVRAPDGTTILHQSSIKQDILEIRRKFTNEARRSYKNYFQAQKRSKMMLTSKGRYLIEFM